MGNHAEAPNGAVLVQEREETQALYTYDVIETLAPVRAAMQNLLAEGIEQIALVAIRLQFDLDGRNDLNELTMRSTTHLLDSLRVLVRKTDHVFLLGHTMYFVLRAANQQGGEIVQARLWEALLWRVHNLNGSELPRPRIIDIGHSGYQEQQASNNLIQPANELRSSFAQAGCKESITDCIDAACAWKLRNEWHLEKQRKSTRQSQVEHEPAPALKLEPIDEELPTLARKLGIPYLSLLPRKLPGSLQRLVTPALAQELRCFPVGRERDTLTVAMLNPRDLDALNRLRAETGLQIFPVLAHPQVLQSALEQLI